MLEMAGVTECSSEILIEISIQRSVYVCGSIR